MGDAMSRFAKALAAAASRRGTLAGLLAGAVMPWSAAAKKKNNNDHKKKRKKRRRRRQRQQAQQQQEQQQLLQRFAPYLGYCQQWCGYKFGFAGPAFEGCFEQARTGTGSCYSATDQGPGYFCTVTLPCGAGQTCCPDFGQSDAGAPVTMGKCCIGNCPQLNGTFICIT